MSKSIFLSQLAAAADHAEATRRDVHQEVADMLAVLRVMPNMKVDVAKREEMITNSGIPVVRAQKAIHQCLVRRWLKCTTSQKEIKRGMSSYRLTESGRRAAETGEINVIQYDRKTEIPRHKRYGKSDPDPDTNSDDL